MNTSTVAPATDLHAAQMIAAKYGCDLRLLIPGDPDEGSTDMWLIDLDVEHGDVQVEDDEGTWRVSVYASADGVFPTPEAARAFATAIIKAATICDDLNAGKVL